jgi:hypothetical protein
MAAPAKQYTYPAQKQKARAPCGQGGVIHFFPIGLAHFLRFAQFYFLLAAANEARLPRGILPPYFIAWLPGIYLI